MYVKIGNYVNDINSTILENHLIRKYGFEKYLFISSNDFDKIDVLFEKMDNIIQLFYDYTINKFLEYKKRKIIVKIHDYDVYSADTTMAYVILPVLKKLKEHKNGAPFVDIEDVPENLHPTEEELEQYKKTGTPDSKFFERWDYILDCMIWSFDQTIKENIGEFDINIIDYETYQNHSKKINYGLKMFGKYYRSLWS